MMQDIEGLKSNYQSSSDNVLSAVMIIGPGLKQSYKTLKAGFDKPNMLIIGDGEKDIAPADIEQLKGRIGNQTKIIINVHGSTENSNHGINLSEQSSSTKSVFSFLKQQAPETPLYVFLTSCESGAAHKDVDALGEGAVLITDVPTKVLSYPILSNIIINKFIENHEVYSPSNHILNNFIYLGLQSFQVSYVTSNEIKTFKMDPELFCSVLHTTKTLNEYRDRFIEFLNSVNKKYEGSFSNFEKEDLETYINAQFLYASYSGSKDIVESILKSKSINAIETSYKKIGITALIFAIQRADIFTFKLLLEKNADPNLMLNNGYNAMLAAAEKGDKEFLQQILKYNGDPNLINMYGVTPLCIAVSKGNIQVANLLVENGARINLAIEGYTTAVYVVDSYGHTTIARHLFKGGLQIDFALGHGFTPLIIAAEGGNSEAVKFLLENNADVNLSSYKGITALFMASQEGKVDTVELLLKHNAKPDLARKDGFTPLIIAACNGHLDIVKLLVENGSEVNIAAFDDNTPLYQAVNTGHLLMVNYLLENGAYIDFLPEKSPLILASSNGNISIVKLLLDAGANVNIARDDGFTPLHAAAWGGHIEVVKLLLASGANPTLKCVGYIPYNVTNHPEIKNMLKEAMEKFEANWSKENIISLELELVVPQSEGHYEKLLSEELYL